MTLIDVYTKLLAATSDGVITVQQYDNFIIGWRDTDEYKCVVFNCRHRDDTDRLLEPFSGESSSHVSTSLEESIANSLGELLWMMISHFSVLPILEIATPTEELLRLATLQNKKQPWVSLYLPTCAVYLIDEVDFSKEKRAIFNPQNCKFIGWADEMLVANFSSEYAMEVNQPYDFSGAYLFANKSKLNAPSLIHFKQYYEAHSAEIVAGYLVNNNEAKLCALNGQGIDDAFAHLTALDESYSKAVKITTDTFRTSLLKVKLQPHTLSAVQASTHLTSRLSHIAAIGGSHSTFAFSITHSLSSGLHSKAGTTNPIFSNVASSFLTAIVTVPSCQQEKFSALGPNVSNEIRVMSGTKLLWDNIDILKLPICRAMMQDQVDKLEQKTKESQGYADLYQRIAKPLSNILAMSQSISTEAARLSMLRGDHLEALHAARYRLSMAFENGHASNGLIKNSMHDLIEYESVNHVAGAMLEILFAIDGVDVDDIGKIPKNWPYELHTKLHVLVSTQPVNANFAMLAGSTDWTNGSSKSAIATSVLIALKEEWVALITKAHQNFFAKPDNQNPIIASEKLTKTQTALECVKRRVHSIFKPSGLSLSLPVDGKKAHAMAITINDLVCFLPENVMIIKGSAVNYPANIDDVIFMPDAYPFRTVGELFLCMSTLTKNATGISFESSSGCKKIVIELASIGNESFEYEKISKILQELHTSSTAGASAGTLPLLLGNFLSPLVSLLHNGLSTHKFSFTASGSALDIFASPDAAISGANGKTTSMFSWSLSKNQISITTSVELHIY